MTTSINTCVKVHSFLDWVPWQSNSISELVYLLKSQISQPAWRWIVQQNQQEICDMLSSTESVLFIPIPGSRRSYHTEFFSREIQELVGGLRKSVLTQTSPVLGQQKSKNLNDRKRIQFKLDEEFTHDISSVDHIVLVDDIYTSGSTLTAAINTITSELKLYDIQNIKISALVLFRRDKSGPIE